ncbi:MAG: PAS domain S-box protein, partial [Methanocalculus sp. MSAO_Arc1]
MPDSVACFRIIVDDEGNPLDYIIGEVNQAFAKMLGKNKKDIEGKGVLEILPGAPDIKLDWVGAFNEGVLEGKQVRFQYYLLPLKRWFEVTGYKEGPGFFITIFRDIDHLKRVAENLEKEKGLLEEMVNGVSDVLALQYPDFTIGFYNQAGYELLGMTPEEVKGKKCYELLGRDRQCQKCATRKALETGKREQMEIYIPEKDIYLDCSSTPLLDREGRVIRIIEQLRDITPEKKQEMKLKEMEERLSLLVMETPSIVYSFKIVEGQPEITYVSGNIEKILGYTPEELINKGIDYWISRLHPEDLKKLNFKFEGDFRSGEYRFKDREGNYRWISDQQRNVEFKNESLVVGTWWDITEWREMEIALREREEKYRAIFHQSVAGVYLHDLEGRILEVNEEACSQTGYSKEELSKLTVFDLHPDRGNTINLPREKISYLWNQWQPGEKYQLEGEHQGKDGRIIDIEISTGPVCLGDKKYILALVQDITRRKEIERALQESETKFRELFNNAGDSIYIHDMAGNFLTSDRGGVDNHAPALGKGLSHCPFFSRPCGHSRLDFKAPRV